MVVLDTGAQKNLLFDPVIIASGKNSVGYIPPYSDYAVEGATYIITIGTTIYNAVGKIEGDRFYLGNYYLMYSSYEDTGEDFLIIFSSLSSAVRANQVRTREPVVEDATVTVELVVEPEEPEDTATYRWKAQDNTLVSVGKNDNPISTLEGGIVNGVFNNARYQLATPFKLLHDKDWAVEWRMSGDVTCDSGMAKILDETGKQTDSTSESILFRKTTKSITITRYSDTHIHCGVKLDEYGYDYTAEHLYRLQNKVNDDGTNMVYLYVDGKKVAPMRHTFSNKSDDGLTDWVVGKNFSMGYMGTPRYIMSGFIMDDIAVWESGASEVFPDNPENSTGKDFLLHQMFGKGIAFELTGKIYWMQ